MLNTGERSSRVKTRRCLLYLAAFSMSLISMKAEWSGKSGRFEWIEE